MSERFREMRRSDRALERVEAERILTVGEYGVLSLHGLNGYPHPVPMSYAFSEGILWMHSATEGTKLDALDVDPHASFCVIGRTEVLPEAFSTRYESVIAYGEIRKVSGEEAVTGLMALVGKYSPAHVEAGRAYIGRALDKTSVLRLDIRHLTGKARR